MRRGRLPTIPREGVVLVKGRNSQGLGEPSPNGGEEVKKFLYDCFVNNL
jgi:hypothetical protein